MPSTELQLADLNFWSLPKADQERIKASIPDLKEWGLDCYRDSHGYWYFSLEEFGIFDEAFINGTQLALDWWYEEMFGEEAVDGSTMHVIVSCEPFEDSETAAVLVSDPPNETDANDYFEPVSGMDIWLCPMNQYLFKHVPKTLHLSFLPSNQ